MADLSRDRRALLEAVHAGRREMLDLFHFVYAHPELSYEERAAAARVVSTLREVGYQVRHPYAGIETCFRADLVFGPGPRVGLVLLSDALPGYAPDGAVRPIHACGHNVIAAAVVGAAKAVASVSPRAGTLVVMGIPGDEIHGPQTVIRGGGKAATAASGAWDDLDAALYAHPEFTNTVWQQSRWMQRCRLDLMGRRAVLSPGPDALDGVREVLARAGEAAERYGRTDFLVEEVHVDGDVEHGAGVHTWIHFLLFADAPGELASRMAYLETMFRDVGMATGSTTTWEPTGPLYQGVLPNRVLTGVLASAFADAGRAFVVAPGPLPFATDFGNLSRRFPGALIGVGREGGWHFHTFEGHDEFGSHDAEAITLVIASILALAAHDLIADAALAARVRAAFEEASR